MRRQTGWVTSLLTAVGVATLCHFIPRKLALTQSDLTLGGLPLPPSQPTTATLKCTRGFVATLTDITGDWFIAQDHPPCGVGGIFLLPVKATAAEMVDLNRRPQVVFQVTANGQVGNASVSLSSGSKTFDERSLEQVIAHPYGRHNCGVCRVSTVVDVDFQGPVWMRESTQ